MPPLVVVRMSHSHLTPVVKAVPAVAAADTVLEEGGRNETLPLPLTVRGWGVGSLTIPQKSHLDYKKNTTKFC
jgi:hypothetical protein